MEVNRHPLTVDVVVQEILRHVSPSMKDLLAFRKVCRLWRQLATPIISSRSLELPMITFKAERAEGNVQDSSFEGCETCNADLSLLPKYIDYLESDADQKIIFSVFHFNAISLDHPIVQEFLEKFGQTVKKLHLNEIDEELDFENSSLSKCDRDRKVKPETFRRLLLSCSNLEELVLGHVDPEDGEDGFLLPDDDFMTKIKRMAWVENIGFVDNPRPQEKFINDLLKVCPSLERFFNVEDIEERFTKALSLSPHLSALKELTLSQEDEFETLVQDESEGNLQLRKLKLDELWLAEEPEEFCGFLDTQKSSLETLIVKDWRVCSWRNVDMNVLPQIPFPDVMEKLEIFKIGDITAHLFVEDEASDLIYRQLRFEPLDFRRQFPVLKTLILGGEATRYDLTDLFTPAGWEPQMVLEGLELPKGIHYQDVGYIGELFPNVKHLTLRGIWEVQLQVLWTQWPLLESLYLGLEDDVNIETSLTGLLLEQIPLIQSLIENGEDINIPAENHSIVNFQNLKELRILGFDEDKDEIVHDLPGAYLSDVSIHYSLSKLPKLEFFGVNMHKFTDEGINFLCNLHGLKWNKSGKWALQCQKNLELEYKQRPNADEEFANYKTNP